VKQQYCAERTVDCKNRTLAQRLDTPAGRAEADGGLPRLGENLAVRPDSLKMNDTIASGKQK